jgi:RHS repeat-associated protein
VIDYVYDALGRMIKKTVDADGAGGGSAETEFLIYDGRRAVLTLESDGDVARRHLWADAVDMLLAEEDAVEGVSFHLADHQGTTRDVVDDEGDLVNHIAFDSFGNIKSQTNAGEGYSIVYAQLIWDPDAEMYRSWTRLYDAAVGRWAGEDPITFGGGTDNLSEYVGNAPTMYIDPSGLVQIPPEVPRRDFTGRIHDHIPSDVPKEWCEDNIDEAISEAQKSIDARKIKGIEHGGLDKIHDAALKREKTWLRKLINKKAALKCVKKVGKKLIGPAVIAYDLISGGPAHAFNEATWPISEVWVDDSKGPPTLPQLPNLPPNYTPIPTERPSPSDIKPPWVK